MATEHSENTTASEESPKSTALRRILTVRNFAIVAVIHSVMFTGLMLCAFVIGKPQPATFLFGFSHGVLYMVVAAACIVAARLRIVSVTTALVVVIVGLLGPYFGAYEFLREDRRLRNERLLTDAA